MIDAIDHQDLTIEEMADQALGGITEIIRTRYSYVPNQQIIDALLILVGECIAREPDPQGALEGCEEALHIHVRIAQRYGDERRTQ
jgi:hypothetical protein